jgi:hypothetical protein
MRAGKLFLLLLLLSSLSLFSFAQDKHQPYAALNGNWLLAGSEDPTQFPFLALAMGVSGNMVYGEGNLQVNCSSKGGMSISFFSTGQIASDGSFLLTASSSLSQIVIRGKVPAEGASAWSGSYSASNLTIRSTDPSKSCADVSGDFEATLYPPLDGTYAGTITGKGLAPGISVSAAITQGAFTSGRRSESGPVYFYTPLSATITVSGLSSHLSVTIPVSPDTRIAGDTVLLTYSMDDGSVLMLAGSFTDSSQSALQVNFTISGNGKLGEVKGSGKLTRQ